MSDINKTPFISVIVPVYNVEKYLPRCLDSILGQSFRDIEVICVNGDSTDNSSEILLQYAEKDERICIITQKGRGLSAARNTGLDAARGKWISFVDSDDWVEKDIYTALVNHCNQNIHAICFNAHEKSSIGEKDIIIDDHSYTNNLKGMIHIDINKCLNLPVNVWNKLFSREKIEYYSLRFPEGIVFEDVVFVMNFFAVCPNVYFVDKVLYYYRRRSDSLMADSRNRQEGVAFNYIYGIQAIYKFWSDHGLFPALQNEFEKICLKFFRYAIESSPAWEQAGIVYSITTALRKWNFEPKQKQLLALREGFITIRIGNFWGRDINRLKPLHGFQKLFYLGNSRDYKVLLIFGFCVLKWKRRITPIS